MKNETTGLTSREAAARLIKYGPNALAQGKSQPAVLAFLSRFSNPLIIILLFAATLSAFLGERVSFFIIITIVLVSTVLDFFNSYRSEKAAGLSGWFWSAAAPMHMVFYIVYGFRTIPYMV